MTVTLVVLGAVAVFLSGTLIGVLLGVKLCYRQLLRDTEGWKHPPGTTGPTHVVEGDWHRGHGW